MVQPSIKLVTVAGPPSSGKTSVLINTIKLLRNDGIRIGVIKFDCLSTDDHLRYEESDIHVKKGLSGGICPDHFFVANIEEGVEWGISNNFDILLPKVPVFATDVPLTSAMYWQSALLII